MKKVTLEQIGKELNVSKVAVFKALNNQSGVSSELRQAIKMKAKELGYKPPRSKYVSGLHFLFVVQKKFYLTTSEQFYNQIFNYLNLECQNIESVLEILFIDNDSPADIIGSAIHNSDHEIAGVFIAGEVDETILAYQKENEIPTIVLDSFSPLHKLTYIYVDNYNLSFNATNYLIGCGHKKIGFVGNIYSTNSIRDRFLGYVKSLIANHIPYNPSYFINENIETSNAFFDILPSDLPTAFVCHCDSAAHTLYIALRYKNLNVPKDISVISFDNTSLCNNLNPPLTSCGISKEKLAKNAFYSMIDLINHKNVGNLSLAPSIYIRKSVRQLPQE